MTKKDLQKKLDEVFPKYQKVCSILENDYGHRGYSKEHCFDEIWKVCFND